MIAIAIETQKLDGFGVLGEHIGHEEDIASGSLGKHVTFQEEQQTSCVAINLGRCAPYVLKPFVALFLY